MTEQRCASYYSATINREHDYPSLQEDLCVDIAIIGAGFTGINTALELAEKGYTVAVIEQNKVAWGASGRNGGQVTGSLSGDSAMLKHMYRSIGHKAENFVWQLRWRGHDIIKKRIVKYGIECDLKFGHLHTAYKPSHMAELEQSYAEAIKHGMNEDVELLGQQETRNYLGTEIYHGAIYNKRNMHLHPLNLCVGEAAAASKLGVQIFEKSQVLSVEHGAQPRVLTQHGSVSARKVMLAGNAYHKLERKKMGGKLFPAAGGIVTTEPLSDELAAEINPKDIAVYDCRFVLDYYRLTADKRLLFGGGANYNGKPSRDIAAELRPGIVSTFPQLKGIRIEHEWSGMMGIVINRIPQLGQLSENVFYAQGYSGHGIASSHVISEIMANAIDGELKEYKVFAECPHIRIPGSDWFGNQFLAMGMWYYGLLEKLR